MFALFRLHQKIGDSHYELWANKWLRHQVTEQGWQIAEFQESLQEGMNAIHRLRQLRMNLGEDGNGENVQPQVPVPSDI